MLPLFHASSQQQQDDSSHNRMNRHAYPSSGLSPTDSPQSPKTFFGNGGGRRVPTMGESGRGFHIRPDKYDDKYKPSSKRTMWQRRRKSLLRLGGMLTGVFCILMLIFPSLRPAALFSALSLFTLGGGEEFNIETVRYYDLSNVGGTSRGWEREERILLCAPLRDAAPHLPMFFSHLRNLTYPHNLIDLAFLVGDSKDDTAELLSDLLAQLQAAENVKETFGEISVLEKDFGQVVNQDVESRHGFAAQAGRRKSMAQARNWLLSAALRPTHSWVYWRDVDVETAPFTILEDLMRHNKDVIVPNVWRPLPEWLGGEQPYDLNSWQESETALALADTLDEDAVIVEGYAEYATWRPHLAYLRDPYGDPDMEMEIDGVGGVSILAKAKVFRSGVHFPAFSFEKHAETEGFGKMAKRMSFSVVGLPHYTIWHLYEPSYEDIRHMEELEQERAAQEAAEQQRRERTERIQQDFDTGASSQFEKDKAAMREAVRKMKEVRGRSHPDEGWAEDERFRGQREETRRKGEEEEGTKKEEERAAAQKVEELPKAPVVEEVAKKIAADVEQKAQVEAKPEAAKPKPDVAKGAALEPPSPPEKSSEVKLQRDADGKAHLEDPLGEIKELGGDSAAAVAEGVRRQEVKMQEAAQRAAAGGGGKS